MNTQEFLHQKGYVAIENYKTLGIDIFKCENNHAVGNSVLHINAEDLALLKTAEDTQQFLTEKLCT